MMKSLLRSLHVESAEILVCRQFVQLPGPFRLQLLDPCLARAWLSRHRENLQVLGGELIQHRDDGDARHSPNCAMR